MPQLQPTVCCTSVLAQSGKKYRLSQQHTQLHKVLPVWPKAAKNTMPQLNQLRIYCVQLNMPRHSLGFENPMNTIEQP
jgi:hypothetical protein